MASTAGVAPAPSTFARWRSDLTELRGRLVSGQILASVAGLAPARPGLKGRLLGLLCIHGQRWSLRSVLRRRLLVFSEALICLSYSGEIGSPSQGPEGEDWSSRQVTLLRLPVISRVLVAACKRLLSYRTGNMVSRGARWNVFR